VWRSCLPILSHLSHRVRTVKRHFPNPTPAVTLTAGGASFLVGNGETDARIRAGRRLRIGPDL